MVLPSVEVPENILSSVTKTCASLEVNGYRPDIVAVKVAKALAALDGRRVVTYEDTLEGLFLALAHRTRSGGLKPPPSKEEITKMYTESVPQGISTIETMKRKRRSHRFFLCRPRSGNVPKRTTP